MYITGMHDNIWLWYRIVAVFINGLHLIVEGAV